MKQTLLVLLACVLTQTTFADPTFTNISEDDFNKIAQDMSANFTHSSVLGASKMGTVIGVQVGLIGAQTGSSRTNEVVKRNAGAELPNLYNGGIMAAVGVPFGLAVEAVLFPKMTASGASLNSTSLAIKYNMNELIPVLPINLAFRGIYSTSAFSFSQNQSGVATNVENNNSVTGLQVLISPMIPIVEPYLGFGLLNSSNELSATGSAIFDPSYTSSQSQKKTNSSTQTLAGVDVNLLLIKMGVEFSSAFGTDRYAFKFAFGF
jgi:hypothetical protein